VPSHPIFNAIPSRENAIQRCTRVYIRQAGRRVLASVGLCALEMIRKRFPAFSPPAKSGSVVYRTAVAIFPRDGEQAGVYARFNSPRRFVRARACISSISPRGSPRPPRFTSLSGFAVIAAPGFRISPAVAFRNFQISGSLSLLSIASLSRLRHATRMRTWRHCDRLPIRSACIRRARIR